MVWHINIYIRHSCIWIGCQSVQLSLDQSCFANWWYSVIFDWPPVCAYRCWKIDTIDCLDIKWGKSSLHSCPVHTCTEIPLDIFSENRAHFRVLTIVTCLIVVHHDEIKEERWKSWDHQQEPKGSCISTVDTQQHISIQDQTQDFKKSKL